MVIFMFLWKSELLLGDYGNLKWPLKFREQINSHKKIIFLVMILNWKVMIAFVEYCIWLHILKLNIHQKRIMCSWLKCWDVEQLAEESYSEKDYLNIEQLFRSLSLLRKYEEPTK